ncbi:hypothetical protein [Roseibium sp. MMSF_3544]|uniref:hypothetical protein n=1 Tax=unclassified Roseibium TaxID=2629323 RepID=UPI00273E163F|nr:hypothetical protein [Roseibium sp. MMSF_3544]
MHAETFIKLESDCGSLMFDPSIGNLPSLRFRTEGSELKPLHTAHWVGSAEAEADPGMSPSLKRLSGDFFCAPFGANDLEDGPAHGLSANSRWMLERQSTKDATFRLERPVMGATLRKSIRLCERAPVLYQTHWLEGGEGGVTCAHHPMIRLTGKGRFFASPKRKAITPEQALDAGRNKLACPGESASIFAFPARSGPDVDLSQLPIGETHEDFVTLIEAEPSSIGWSAILREEEGDIVFFLKDSSVLPITMLWHSNGGRDYWPWNGSHKGVLGVEDGRAAGAEGHRASLCDNAVARCGVPTFFPLASGKTHRIAHVCGAIKTPPGWAEISDIQLGSGELHILERSGARVALPFDTDFFQRDETHGNR